MMDIYVKDTNAIIELIKRRIKIMAYIIIRGSEKQGGYVSMVEKGRVKGEVRTKRYICGLGSMTMSEFRAFQTWAHGFKDQEERKAMVLASGVAISEKEKVPIKIAAAKVQKKTTVKPMKKVHVVKKRKVVLKRYPVPTLMEYKGIERGKTHTQIMMERKRQEKIEKAMREEERPKLEKWKTKMSFEPGMGK